jgi:hypothetical protein
MKKNFKWISLPIISLLIAGCSTHVIGPSYGTTTIVDDGANITNTTYQEIYDRIYVGFGAEFSAKEIVDIIARQVLSEAGRTQEEINTRVNEKLDAYYSDSYKVDGVFYESLMINGLKKQGYNIVCSNEDVPFVGTKTDFTTYNQLSSVLACDYSDLISRKLEPEIRVEMLKEEYILSQRASFLSSKTIRKVEAFRINPKNSSIASQFTSLFEAAIVAGIDDDTSFTDIVVQDNGLEEQWKDQKIAELDEDFGMIDPDSTFYVDPNGVGITEAQKSTIKTRINTYSANGSYSIYHGYNLAKRIIEDTSFLVSKVGTSDDTTIIDSVIDPLIKKSASTIVLDDNGMLTSPFDSNSIVVKSGSDYYFVHVTLIDATSNTALKREAARALANTSGNVSNAITYYLEQFNVKSYEQSIYDYINEQYDFEAK